MNIELEKQLQDLPEEVAQAKAQWQKATLDRERAEAFLYLHFKHEFPEATATEIKAHINKSDGRHQAVQLEISFEQIYNAKYETLMCQKRLAGLREAF